MKSRCLAYVQQGQVCVVFVLIAVIRSVIKDVIGVIICVFWFLNLSFLFWKDLT